MPEKSERLAEAIERFRSALENARLAVKDAKESGKTVIGVYCAFMPCDLVRAAGAIPVSLCGTDAEAVSAAEVALPRNFCPLIKSSYGLAVTDACPFFHFSDGLIGETTCDGKKKTFELLAELKPVHVMQLPAGGADGNRTALAAWVGEMHRVGHFIEKLSGNTIQESRLRDEIRESNEIRKLQARIATSFEREEPAMSWNELLVVQECGGFFPDRRGYRDMLRELVAALEEEGAQPGDGPSRRPRVLVTGTPISFRTNKVMRLAEEAGAIIVCHDACSGVKVYDRLIDETIDPWEALARYTLGLPCACMSPNPGRIDLLRRCAAKYRPDGVIDTVWQACHTFNVESTMVKQAVHDQLGLAYLKIETDYAENDVEQLRTRLEAFVESLQ